jgi:hypothetical protein
LALKINGIDGKFSVPNIISRAYAHRPFADQTMTFSITSNETKKTETKQVDVKAVIGKAWGFVSGRAATYGPCNEYFKTLARKKTLQEVLNEGDITLHCLTPKEGHKSDEMPYANTAGRDIGIDPALLVEPDKLGCTLIHELAHVAGATTNTRDSNALAAELALKSCLCPSQFNKDELGLIRIKQPGSRGSRFA